MKDMSSVIIPDSTQINADELQTGPITVKIADVKIKGGKEQPVDIVLDGMEKVYRPCKSMARVMVHAWGADASKYIGRSLTIYCDPRVRWGGLEVGGLRISHMSHIDSAMTMALTATKGNKKPFTVQPLIETAPVAEPESEDPRAVRIREALTAAGMSEAWFREHAGLALKSLSKSLEWIADPKNAESA